MNTTFMIYLFIYLFFSRGGGEGVGWVSWSSKSVAKMLCILQTTKEKQINVFWIENELIYFETKNNFLIFICQVFLFCWILLCCPKHSDLAFLLRKLRQLQEKRKFTKSFKETKKYIFKNIYSKIYIQTLSGSEIAKKMLCLQYVDWVYN